MVDTLKNVCRNRHDSIDMYRNVADLSGDRETVGAEQAAVLEYKMPLLCLGVGCPLCSIHPLELRSASTTFHFIHYVAHMQHYQHRCRNMLTCVEIRRSMQSSVDVFGHMSSQIRCWDDEMYPWKSSYDDMCGRMIENRMSKHMRNLPLRPNISKHIQLFGPVCQRRPNVSKCLPPCRRFALFCVDW